MINTHETLSAASITGADASQSHGVHEECGVFGIYDLSGNDVAASVYYGLCSLQHRGQESCGIAVTDTSGANGNIASHKDLGLVQEVFKAETISKLHGNLGVGHVRYSTTGALYPGKRSAPCS